ncbi:MAG: ABC transporter permease, partial [Alphaproteobacteria bacterium]
MEKRTETPISLMLISPMIAVALTMISAAIMFALLGKDPLTALQTYFLDPLSDSWGLQEVAVKATPLVLIAVGLAVCYRAKVWNIGA